jgi:hypothetical protein
MSGRIPTWVAVASLAGMVSPSHVGAQNTICGGGIRYVEKPDRGPYVKKERPLEARAGANYGVDFNSSIHVSVDTDCLLSRLDQFNSASPDQPARLTLGRRMDSLTAVLRQIPAAIEQLQQTFLAYANPDVDAQVREQKLNASSATIQDILHTLQSVSQARLESGGTASAEAARQSKREMAAVFSKAGYDWEALRQLLDRELRTAGADLDRLRGAEQYKVEMRAHLLTSKGPFPVPLAGYNTEAPCAETRLDPIQLAPSPAQVALYQKAESLEKQIGAVRGIGNVIMAQVAADLDQARPEVESLLTRAERAVQPVMEAGRSTLKWADKATMSQWLNGLAASLAADPEGPAAQASLESLGSELDKLGADLATVRSLVSLRDDLRGASALEGMQAILARADVIRRATRPPGPMGVLRPETWKAHADVSSQVAAEIGKLGKTLRDRIRNDPDGPLHDIERLRGALVQAGDSLQTLPREALELAARLLGLSPVLIASTLPEPAGLQRRDIGPGLDTDLELRTICAERHENDVVQVVYRFFAGDKEIQGGGWTDRFRLRIYGWSARFAAGLAFAVREHTEVWRPGAAVSWIFSHAGWPGENDRGAGSGTGLGRVGLGLTAVNLHFEGAEAIELGIGPSLSLLGDRIIFGGGWNLQAHDDHLYGLLSVRLLDIARGPPP